MTANHSPDAAVRDADLIRWLDGELDEDERIRIDEALATDAALSARLEQLRARSTGLAALLRASDPPPAAASSPPVAPEATVAKVIELNAAWAAQQGVEPHIVPPPRPLPGWLRVAAVIALLLAGSLFAPPVRAWIAGVLAPVLGGGEEAGSSVPPAATARVDTLVVMFLTTTRSFTIEFATAPAAGRLVVDRSAVDHASAALYTAGGGEELQRIREDLFRVANTPASTADYRFVLPPEVTVVIVRIPGRDDEVWRFGTGEESRTLDLGAREVDPGPVIATPPPRERATRSAPNGPGTGRATAGGPG